MDSNITSAVAFRIGVNDLPLIFDFIKIKLTTKIIAYTINKYLCFRSIPKSTLSKNMNMCPYVKNNTTTKLTNTEIFLKFFFKIQERKTVIPIMEITSPIGKTKEDGRTSLRLFT
jgi:hypothetical protein